MLDISLICDVMICYASMQYATLLCYRLVCGMMDHLYVTYEEIETS